jgi:hypothetical protein
MAIGLEHQIVEGIFVGFEAQGFEAVADALAGNGFAFLPVFGINNFLDSRLENLIEIIVLFN